MKNSERHRELVRGILETTSAKVMFAMQLDETGTMRPRLLGRPRTAIGKQGDHVSAYALIVRSIVRCVSGERPLHDAVRLLCFYADQLSALYGSEQKPASGTGVRTRSMTALEAKADGPSDKIFSIYKHYNEQYQEKIRSDRSLDGARMDEKREDVWTHEQTFWLPLVELLARNLLSLRNKVPKTSFPKEGSIAPPKGEGSRVQQALAKLDEIHSHLEGERSYHAEEGGREGGGEGGGSGEGSGSAEEADLAEDESCLYEEHGNEVLNGMLDCFWYPIIPEDRLLTDAPKGYNSGTFMRSNSVEDLIDVTANHLILIFTTYPRFLDSDWREPLTDDFCKLIWSGVRSTGDVATSHIDDPAKYADFLRPVKDILKVGVGFPQSASSSVESSEKSLSLLSDGTSSPTPP